MSYLVFKSAFVTRIKFDFAAAQLAADVVDSWIEKNK